MPTVIASLENAEGTRCVDLIRRDDGGFVFTECRRDPEDGGRWTLVATYATTVYPSRDAVTRAAAARIPWLADHLG